MLIEFAGNLPAPSPGRSGSASSDCRIQECQTPVDLWVDVLEGKVRLEASVPEKSPTVRGFVSLLVEGLTGATLEEIRELPDDLLPSLGLAETLGMTRQRGFRGIVGHIKRRAAAGDGATAPNSGGALPKPGLFPGK